jgi:hypothetical protein
MGARMLITYSENPLFWGAYNVMYVVYSENPSLRGFISRWVGGGRTGGNVSMVNLLTEIHLQIQNRSIYIYIYIYVYIYIYLYLYTSSIVASGRTCDIKRIRSYMNFGNPKCHHHGQDHMVQVKHKVSTRLLIDSSAACEPMFEHNASSSKQTSMNTFFKGESLPSLPLPPAGPGPGPDGPLGPVGQVSCRQLGATLQYFKCLIFGTRG